MSSRCRPSRPRTTAVTNPVTTANSRGWSPTSPSRSTTPTPPSSASRNVRRGATPAIAAQAMAARLFRTTATPTANAASTRGAGRVVVAAIPPARRTTAAPKAQRRTTDRSVTAAHQKAALATKPWASSMVDQSRSARTPIAATSTGTRNAPRWKRVPALAGRVVRRPRPATRQAPVAAPSAAIFAASGI